MPFGKYSLIARCEVLTVVLLRIPIFWDVTLCCSGYNSPCFAGSQCLHLQGQAYLFLDCLTSRRRHYDPANRREVQPQRHRVTSQITSNSSLILREFPSLCARSIAIRNVWAGGGPASAVTVLQGVKRLQRVSMNHCSLNLTFDFQNVSEVVTPCSINNPHCL
jgi:hypothetical protein